MNGADRAFTASTATRCRRHRNGPCDRALEHADLGDGSRVVRLYRLGLPQPEVNFFLWSGTGRSLLEGGLRVGYDWNDGNCDLSLWRPQHHQPDPASSAASATTLTGFINEPRLWVGSGQFLIRASLRGEPPWCAGRSGSLFPRKAPAGRGTVCVRGHVHSSLPRANVRLRIRALGGETAFVLTHLPGSLFGLGSASTAGRTVTARRRRRGPAGVVRLRIRPAETSSAAEFGDSDGSRNRNAATRPATTPPMCADAGSTAHVLSSGTAVNYPASSGATYSNGIRPATAAERVAFVGLLLRPTRASSSSISPWVRPRHQAGMRAGIGRTTAGQPTPPVRCGIAREVVSSMPPKNEVPAGQRAGRGAAVPTLAAMCSSRAVRQRCGGGCRVRRATAMVPAEPQQEPVPSPGGDTGEAPAASNDRRSG